MISQTKLKMKITPGYIVHTGNESYSYIGPKLWNSLAEIVKKSNTLETYKSVLEELTITECPCFIRRTYIE